MASNDKTIPVTDRTFQKKVIDHSRVVPVLADFWEEGVAPCRLAAERLKALAAEYAGKIRVARIDASANPGVTQALKISAFPTLIVFKDEHLVFNQAGALPEAGYRELVEQVIALDIKAMTAGR
jgi:thioredoxin 1